LRLLLLVRPCLSLSRPRQDPNLARHRSFTTLSLLRFPDYIVNRWLSTQADFIPGCVNRATLKAYKHYLSSFSCSCCLIYIGVVADTTLRTIENCHSAGAIRLNRYLDRCITIVAQYRLTHRIDPHLSQGLPVTTLNASYLVFCQHLVHTITNSIILPLFPIVSDR
jgi:hypothetical protein